MRRWDGNNLTNQRTDLVVQHLKYCFGCSEMPEQSPSSKYFCIIVLHDCVPKQQASTSERSDSIYYVCSLWDASNSSYMKMIVLSGFSYFC